MTGWFATGGWDLGSVNSNHSSTIIGIEHSRQISLATDQSNLEKKSKHALFIHQDSLSGHDDTG